jgi:hypothetical protein
MKIQGPNGQSNSGGRSNSVSAATAASPVVKVDQLSAPTFAPSVAIDQVQLSNLAELAAASDLSPTHVAKLSSLSATVSSGRYQVAAGIVSNSIIEASIQLTGGNYA